MHLWLSGLLQPLIPSSLAPFCNNWRADQIIRAWLGFEEAKNLWFISFGAGFAAWPMKPIGRQGKELRRSEIDRGWVPYSFIHILCSSSRGLYVSANKIHSHIGSHTGSYTYCVLHPVDFMCFHTLCHNAAVIEAKKMIKKTCNCKRLPSHIGQEQACTRITWLSFVRLSSCRKWLNTQKNS